MQSLYTITCGRIDRDKEVDFDSMPEAIQEKIIQYGLTKKLNDGLSQWSFDNFRAIEGNSQKTQADFMEFTWDSFNTKLEKLLEGTWSAFGGGGGKAGDAILVEMREKLRIKTGLSSAKAKKAYRTRADILATCRGMVERAFKANGRKYAAKNLDYGAQDFFDKLVAKAEKIVAMRKEDDLPDVDVSEYA